MRSLLIHLNCYKKMFTFFSPSMRMSGKNVNLGDKEIKKSDFYKNKKVAKIDDIDVNKILVSKEEPYGTKNSFKYFIGYNDNDVVIRPLCIKLPQMTSYVRNFSEKKYVKRKSTMQVFINNNARFYCQSRKKHYLETFLEESKYETKNIKMENLIGDDLEKSLSGESDNDSYDETESDNEKKKG